MQDQQGTDKELTPEQAKQKREKLLRQQTDRAREADERESSSEANDATVTTFILPGD